MAPGGRLRRAPHSAPSPHHTSLPLAANTLKRYNDPTNPTSNHIANSYNRLYRMHPERCYEVVRMPNVPDGAEVFVGTDGNTEEDTFTFPKLRRLPVCRADYEIETEAYSRRADIKRVSKRTDEEIPAYLSKAFYRPIHGSSPTIFTIASRRAERLCEHQYPHAHRDVIKVCEEAEWAFRRWWEHLEDDELVEVDEKLAKEVYIKEFLNAYRAQLTQLDDAHPEHKERYCNYRDRHAEYERTNDYPAADGVCYPYIEYYWVSPRWKQLIAADGRKGGQQAAEDDREVGVGFQDGADLEKLARERFEKVWNGITLQAEFYDTYMFDFLGLRNIYMQNFMRIYLGRANSSEESLQAEQTGARLVTTKLDRAVRVYVVEITDPEHLSAPIQVEVAVKNEDDIEIREAIDDAG
jgi:hypothetical protein